MQDATANESPVESKPKAKRKPTRRRKKAAAADAGAAAPPSKRRPGRPRKNGSLIKRCYVEPTPEKHITIGPYLYQFRAAAAQVDAAKAEMQRKRLELELYMARDPAYARLQSELGERREAIKTAADEYNSTVMSMSNDIGIPLDGASINAETGRVFLLADGKVEPATEATILAAHR